MGSMRRMWTRIMDLGRLRFMDNCRVGRRVRDILRRYHRCAEGTGCHTNGLVGHVPLQKYRGKGGMGLVILKQVNSLDTPEQMNFEQSL